MAILESALRSILVANANVSALVGAGAAARIYPLDDLPQGCEYPAISYAHVSEDNVYTLALDVPGYVKVRMEYHIWGASYLKMRELLKKVKQALQGFRGTQDTIEIYSVVCITSEDLPEPEPGLYHGLVEFYVEHKEV